MGVVEVLVALYPQVRLGRGLGLESGMGVDELGELGEPVEPVELVESVRVGMVELGLVVLVRAVLVVVEARVMV